MTTDQQAAVTVDELKRAWRAVQNGQFRGPRPSADPAATRRTDTVREGLSWAPARTEQVVPVVGCGGSCGATTVAVAMAEACPERSRVVGCGSASTSGLVAASTAELGAGPTGWTNGRRGELLLDRVSTVLAGPAEVPVPAPCPPPVDLTVLDVGWDLGQLLASRCWLTDRIFKADLLVVVASCTGAGLRRLEAALDLMGEVPAVAAVVGPPFRKWPAEVRPFIGTKTRNLDRDGRLFAVPEDRRLNTIGLSPAPLPPTVLAAGAALRDVALRDVALRDVALAHHTENGSVS